MERARNPRPLRNFFSVLVLLSALLLVHKQAPHLLPFFVGKKSFSTASNDIINIALIECPGGTDKGPDGHRKDSKYLVDALNQEGTNTKLFQYEDAKFDTVFNEIVTKHKAHAYLSRVDPGEYEACDEDMYHAFLNKLISVGVLPYNSPKDMINLGSKKSLLNLGGMSFFPNSTYVYSSLEQFDAFFPKTLRLHGSRVIKQNRGSKGEGVWWVQLLGSSSRGKDFSPFDGVMSQLLSLFTVKKEESPNVKSPKPDFYSELLPEFSLFENLGREEPEEDSSVPAMDIRLIEAKDNHEEVTTLSEFRNKIVKGYLSTAQDFVVDMEYLPRISEGEVRLILSGKTVLFVVNKQPKAANTTNTFSANLGAGATHKWEDPSEWSEVVEPFKRSLDKMLRRMNVDRAPIFWTVDFIRYGEVGEKDLRFVVSEINASCVGFSANPEMGAVIAKLLVNELSKELKFPLKE